MKLTTLFFLILLVFCTNILKANTVMTWVPTYGIQTCYEHLTDPNKDGWFKNGLTHIGLQWWVPYDNGDVGFITKYSYKGLGDLSDDVKKYVAWGKENSVKMLLCFSNSRDNGFDWEIARKVYIENPDTTVSNLMRIVNQFDLDGVDIDFESGDYDNEKVQFISFIEKLSNVLHENGKELSIDLHSTPCYLYPGPTWANDLAPYVDFMNVMGYEDRYEGNEETFSYCPNDPTQAGKPVFKYSYTHDYFTNVKQVEESKVNIGIPSYNSDEGNGGYWGGVSVTDNIKIISEKCPNMGLAIWDLRLTAEGLWLESETWKMIGDIKKKNIDPTSLVDNNISDTRFIKIKSSMIHILGIPSGIAQIYNMNGQLIYKEAITSSSMTISTSKLSMGTYILRVQRVNKAMNVIKFVKLKDGC